MPVTTASKVQALREDFRSAARLADLLGVNRSQVTRWLRGAGIDPLNAEKIELLELVWANLLRLYAPDAAFDWLMGLNPHLGDRRPVDLIRITTIPICTAASMAVNGPCRASSNISRSSVVASRNRRGCCAGDCHWPSPPSSFRTTRR
jgi:hypothetical protein